MNYINYILIFCSVVIFSLLACKNTTNFSTKSQESKIIIVKSLIDSLIKLKNKPQIINDYIQLSQIEKMVSIDSLVEINTNFRFSNSISIKGEQEIFLTSVEFLKYDYLKPSPNNKKIIAFIPVLLLDKLGNVVNYTCIVKYNDYAIDTLKEYKFNLLPLLDNDKIQSLIKSRTNRYNEFQKNKDKVDINGINKIQEQVTFEANQNKKEKEEYNKLKKAYQQEVDRESQDNELYTIIEDTYGAVSKEDYSKVYQYINNGEMNLIQNMLVSRRIFYLNRGTKCYLSKSGFSLVKIRIPNTEIELFVNIESIKK
jgi:hypothetical protein